MKKNYQYKMNKIKGTMSYCLSKYMYIYAFSYRGIIAHFLNWSILQIYRNLWVHNKNFLHRNFCINTMNRNCSK